MQYLNVFIALCSNMYNDKGEITSLHTGVCVSILGAVVGVRQLQTTTNSNKNTKTYKQKGSLSWNSMIGLLYDIICAFYYDVHILPKMQMISFLV